MAVTKKDVVLKINAEIGLPQKECSNIVECLFDIIKSELESGSAVRISGFGKWTVKQKKQRKGRNPQTGESMAIAARRVVMFKSSMVLRGELNN